MFLSNNNFSPSCPCPLSPPLSTLLADNSNTLVQQQKMINKLLNRAASWCPNRKTIINKLQKYKIQVNTTKESLSSSSAETRTTKNVYNIYD
jgi:hypothetical protein